MVGFSNDVVRKVYDVLSKPYFYLEMKQKLDGEITIDPRYNYLFIKQLDKFYSESAVDYDPNMPDEGKVALFISDFMNNIADGYLPEPEPEAQLEDDVLNIPPLASRGGTEVKQVVDLGQTKPSVRRNYDLEEG